jgi:hypothetical protein
MTKDKTVTMSREQFEIWALGKNHPVLGFIDRHWLGLGDDQFGYANEYVQGLWVAYNEFANPVVERQEPVVIDLDAVDWETIQQAADESNWMPNEYMRNEWVADVCNFLKYGRADPSPTAPVAAIDPVLGSTPEDHMRWLLDKVVNPSDYPQSVLHDQIRDTLARLGKVKELNQ